MLANPETHDKKLNRINDHFSESEGNKLLSSGFFNVFYEE